MPAIAKQSPWTIQKSVVFAVFVRELNARFGRYSLGLAWALAEPVVYILMFAFIRHRFSGADIAGVPPILFFTAGVLTFTLWRNIITTAFGAIESNQGLFNYQRVKPADIVVARALLEVLVVLATGAVLFFCLRLAGYAFVWNNTLAVLGVIACLVMFAGGLGLVGCIVGPLWQDSKVIVPMILRPFFYVSGIFFPANALPEPIREIALLNPVLHATELLRGGVFAAYTSHEGDWGYLFEFSVITLFVGLVVYRLFRVTVLTSGYIR